jgi:hypothetical protein
VLLNFRLCFILQLLFLPIYISSFNIVIYDTNISIYSSSNLLFPPYLFFCFPIDGEWFQFPEGKKRHGFGRFVNCGEIYDGEWREGVIYGQGKYTFSSGASYDGQWVDNKFQGRGTYIWPSGAMYIGDWVENKMHGMGAFLTSSGERYQGLFHNDRFQNETGQWISPAGQEREKLYSLS